MNKNEKRLIPVALNDLGLVPLGIQVFILKSWPNLTKTLSHIETVDPAMLFFGRRSYFEPPPAFAPCEFLGFFQEGFPYASGTHFRHDIERLKSAGHVNASAGLTCALCFPHLNMGSSSGCIDNRIDRGCPGTRLISPFSSSFRIIW